LLYLISNRLAFPHNPETTTIEVAREAAQAGCRLIQIREKDLSARALCEFARSVIDAVRPYGAKVLVNDRLDVAFATGADGVHLRASSLRASDAHKVAAGKGNNDFLIGVSTHSLDEALAAESGGADFLVCGPVYDTPSKREYGFPIGIDRFAVICRTVKIPVLALGGINISNFREPLRRGAAGIAAIGLFTDPQNVRSNVEKMLDAGI
jgi:thiamine-phosphate pyrophosphorylase